MDDMMLAAGATNFVHIIQHQLPDGDVLAFPIVYNYNGKFLNEESITSANFERKVL